MLFLYEKCWPLLRILKDVKDCKDVNYKEKENNLIGRAMLSLTIIKEQMNSVFQTTPCVEGKSKRTINNKEKTNEEIQPHKENTTDNCANNAVLFGH